MAFQLAQQEVAASAEASNMPSKAAKEQKSLAPAPLIARLATPSRNRAQPKPNSTLRADAPAFVPGASFVTAPVAEIRKEPQETAVASAIEQQKPQEDESKLPPVVSVKLMATKGCAIVILRNAAVIELSAAMRVAVVDGVCVEVRKHVRQRDTDNDDSIEEGVFVAWGHRVARRVEVTEEGLESYFNGLSAVAEPEGLHPQAPFEEELQLFELASSGPAKLNKSPKADVANQARMLEGPHGRPELVRSLWESKQKLDEIWNRPPPPMGRSLMQRVARDQLFPHSGKEGKEHENRAGEKLEELASAVGLLEGVPHGASFLDLCGGPGAWSQFLLKKEELAMRGFGFTLRSGAGGDEDWHAQEKDDWYPDLLAHPKWTALWGADGTGDLLKATNLLQSTGELRKKGGVFLCVADGGFSDKDIPANLLELYFYRLFLAELLTAASCLQPGGRFVCKLYTSCSTATSALLFLTTRLFEHSAIVKPMTSRVAGPERYLYASGFRQGTETDSIKAALLKSHEAGAGVSPLQAPLLTPVVEEEEMMKDSIFMQKLQSMVSRLLERQAGSLFAIVERAELLEDIALDAAQKAQEGATKFAEAAAARREAHRQERAERHERKDRERAERSKEWGGQRQKNFRGSNRRLGAWGGA
eukprot:TRINITY_DN1451_c0_g1_i3.p1 TRINITY_DN1451_c0_g1~~TRINITY_DN1451_c0_g1_i3.p1  ORF type:complete len:673 (-),score=201.69 TRINITY_DN1451_c0_g1_i3:153-2090(-)